MIGGTIRSARKARGWTQQQLATEAGVSRRHLIALEHGANVSIDILRKVALALDLHEIELGEVTLMSGADRPHPSSLEIRDQASEEPWAAKPPLRRGKERSSYAVAAEISRLQPPVEREETVEIANSVMEVDEILIRVGDDSFEDAGLKAGELLVVQLRPSGDAATGELVILTVGNKVDAGRWWEKRGRRELRYDSGGKRDLTRSRAVVIRGVITYSLS